MPRQVFERDIQHLQDELLALGSKVETMLLDSVQTMKRRDRTSARRLIAEDRSINEKRFEIEDETLAAIKEDDEALLRFAFRWLKFSLFGEETIEIRPEALGPMSTPPRK